MVEIAKVCLEYLAIFLLIYVVYYVFGYLKLKKYNRKTAPIGIKYLMYKYNLDIVKLGYKEIYKTLMLADSFILSTIYILTKIVDNIYIRFLVAFILIFPLFAGVYHIVAMYYKKKEDE